MPDCGDVRRTKREKQDGWAKKDEKMKDGDADADADADEEVEVEQ